MDRVHQLSKRRIAALLSAALLEENAALHRESRLPEDFLPDPPREAGVLVPLLRIQGAWHILFTRRTPSLPEHSDQVAFPGGRSDPDDLGPEQTALREAREEIGLKPEKVEILGRLKALRTITNYCVTPIVGAIPWPYPFQLAEVEVSRVFTIPLQWLADPTHRRILQRELPPPYSPVPVIYFDRYDNELLWGVSAQITMDLLRALQLLEPDP